jgi:hypothetical protein
MTQAAALLVTTQQFVDNARTQAATSYYLGMRDAFEAVFRACHGVDDDADAMSAAQHVLAQMGPAERDELMSVSHDTLRMRRAATVAETVRVV